MCPNCPLYFLHSIAAPIHSALMSRLAMYSKTLANFFRLKTPCLPLQARTPPLLIIDGAGLYPCGYRQYVLYFSLGYLLFPGDFWRKI